MTEVKRIKQCLELCSKGECEKCIYRRWIREKCFKVLAYDALTVIEELSVEDSQLRIDFD